MPVANAPFVPQFGAGAPATPPQVPNQLYFDTSTVPYTGYVFSGGAWHAFTSIGGGGQQVYPTFVAPVNANYSWLNQGTASVVVNANGGISIVCPGGGTNIRGRALIAAPPATPYTLTAGVLASMTNQNNIEMGIFFRDTVTQKFSTLDAFSAGQDVHVGHWTNGTTFSADAALVSSVWGGGMIWFQLANDGATLRYRFSFDGFFFYEFFTEAVGAFLTPNQVGFHCINTIGGNTAAITLLSWTF